MAEFLVSGVRGLEQKREISVFRAIPPAGDTVGNKRSFIAHKNWTAGWKLSQTQDFKRRILPRVMMSAFEQ